MDVEELLPQREETIVHRLREWADGMKPSLWPSRWRLRRILRAIWRLQADTAYKMPRPKGENDIHTMAVNLFWRRTTSREFLPITETSVLAYLRGREGKQETPEEIWARLRFDSIALEKKGFIKASKAQAGREDEDWVYELTNLGYDELCPWYQRIASELLAAVIGAISGAIFGTLTARYLQN
ncbi:MAG: hypothetical protein NTX71_07605 [Candidatus Aureabacteria bacterium]|nr:hypothetical protein [Candidatus Auribacterota bacterium]